MTGQPQRLLDLTGLAALVAELRDRGYDVFGPQVRDGVITNGRLGSIDELPIGWTDDQAGGHYRLEPRDDRARFGYAVGPHSWKEILHPPRAKVWTISRRPPPGEVPVEVRGEVPVEVRGKVAVAMHEPDRPRRAFVGVRPCELAAMAKQDRVLLEGPHPDPTYQANRADVFIVAVACGDPADTCFCPSMGTGPAVGPGADLAMTELVGPDGDDPTYAVLAVTGHGADVLASIPSQPITAESREAAARVVEEAERAMTRSLDTDGIRDLIYDNLEASQWDEVGQRCLTCGNCTLACPTCFCTDLEDTTDLIGDHTDRWRVWDSCFSLDFSHLGPGPIRESAGARYRQWFVHKLASWIDQYDESGCVGCGRCITWCPVGIDLTAELATMRERAAS